MVVTRILGTYQVKDHTCPQLRPLSDLASAAPGPLTRMVSTRLWT